MCYMPIQSYPVLLYILNIIKFWVQILKLLIKDFLKSLGCLACLQYIFIRFRIVMAARIAFTVGWDMALYSSEYLSTKLHCVTSQNTVLLTLCYSVSGLNHGSFGPRHC